MSERVANPYVLPPSIADDRGRAVLSLMTQVAASFDWKPGLAVAWADVPTPMLPFAVRALALQDLVQPGMREDVVRRFIANAWALKALQGKVVGVRFGLGLLGMDVEWRQWFAVTPKGPPGTYVAIVTVRDEVFEGEGRALTARLQRAALNMVDVMKRWSQEGPLRFAVPGPDVPVYVGAVFRTRVRSRVSTEPVTRLVGQAPIFLGAAFRTRIRSRPQVS